MKHEGRASLIESSSATQLQSLWAECLYLKGLPEESSHLARHSGSSQITAAGGFEYFAVSENKLHWVGLSWQRGWVCGFEVKRRREDEKSHFTRVGSLYQENCNIVSVYIAKSFILM